MATQTTVAGTKSRGLPAWVTPSPFGGGRSSEAEVTVAVSNGQLTMSSGERTATLRPVRAVLGHGTLHLTTTAPRTHLRLRFEREPVPAIARQDYAFLGQLYRRLDAAGVRDLVVALRDSGVRLSVTPRLRRGAGSHRAIAWVSGFGFVCVELALFGVPATVLSALISGSYRTGSTLIAVALAIGLAAFLVLAIAASPLPVLIRRQLGHGSIRDPIRYFDTWAGRPLEHQDQRKRPTFVPGVPVVHTAVLLVACAIYALLPVWSLLSVQSATPVQTDGTVPVPSWLDSDAVSLLGYAGAAVLLALFAVSVLRWRQDRELHGIRWATLVGAVICFAFGQAETQPDSSLEVWLEVAIIVMAVAFTSGRVALGFGVLLAMIGLTLAGGFGLFHEPSQLLVLLPVSGLIGAITARYLPGGARLVPLAPARAVRVQHLVWLLWAVTVVLGVGLAVAATRLIQLA